MQMGFSLGKLPVQVGLHGWWQSTGLTKNKMNKNNVAFSKKKKKKKSNLYKSDTENEATEFPKCIVLESLEETCLAN